MINWRLVAGNLSEAVGGDLWVTDDNIKLAAHFVLGFNPEIHELDACVTEKYRLAYNYVMTLANRKGLVERDKIQKLIGFMKQLRVSEQYVREVLEEAEDQPSTETRNRALENFDARNFHQEIVTHCKTLFGQGNYFHALNEACKAYNLAVKYRLNTTKDGTSLMLSELGQDKRVRAVSGNTESERNFLEGIKYLSAGLIQGFRNPTSHETVRTWRIEEQDCLDILSLASYLFRQLDKATVIP